MKSAKLIVLAGVSLAALSTPALAQGTGDSDTNNVSVSNEIIVTARRRAESVQDVPLVVNAVTSQSLEKLNIRNFKDVASLVPGLQLSPDPHGTAPTATLRGVNLDPNNSGSNSTVQFYLNDAVISTGFLLQNMFDVQQIEVLRGPQGTLRGIASPSGSITVTTTKPDLAEIGGYVTGTVNTIGGINANGAVNVPVIKDMLAVRVAGIVNDDEGTRVHSINDPSANPYDHGRGERVTVRFDPVDSIDIIGTYQHFLNNIHYFDQVESANLALGKPVVGTLVRPLDRLAVENAISYTRENYNVWNIQAQWRFAGQKLNYVGGWATQSLFGQRRDDQGNAFGAEYPGDASADQITSPNLQNYGQLSPTHSKQYSHEIRLSSDERVFGIFDYIVGGLINRLANTTNLLVHTPIFAGPASPTTYVGMYTSAPVIQNRTLERSVFGNLTVHLGEATEISGGLRYIHFNNKSNLPGTDANFHTTIYSASIKHRFNQNVMVYASTGSSWRAGVGTNGIILASTGNVAYSDPALSAILGIIPETSKSYEVGIKTDWLDRRLKLNVTFYHQTFKNYIFSSPVVQILNDLGGDPPTYVPSLSRSGLGVGVPVTVNGVEGEFAFQPDDHFNMGITASYALGKVKNGVVPCNNGPITPPAQVNFCTVTQRSGLTAPFNASAQAEYTRPAFGESDGFLRGQFTFSGASQVDPTNPYDNVKAYGLLNLFLGLRDHDGAWEVNAYVKNVFNTQRVLTRLASPYIATYISGGKVSDYRGITVTDPREFGITGSFRFGSH